MGVELRTAATKASPERVWAVWSDFTTWSKWNPNVKEMKMNGAFAPGTTGVMVTPDRGKYPITLRKIDTGMRFTMESAVVVGATFLFTCTIAPAAGGGSLVAQSVTMTGPLAFMWMPLIGGSLAKSFEPVLAGLVRYLDGG